MSKGDELKDLIIFARQMNWQYQLSDFTDEALKSIQRSVDIARRELMDSLEMRDILQLEELNNLTFGIQTALHDDISAAAQIAGKASYVEYNNILSFDGKISDVSGAAVGFTDVAVSAGQLKSMIVDTPVGGALLSNWVSTSFDAALVQNFKEEFGAGVLKGESIKKLMGRIPDGMNMLNREMVSLTRTYIADINNRAAGEVYKANSDIIKEEQWSAALEVSGRGSSTCLRCACLHGSKYPINSFHIRPPLHPSCRCFMVPLTVSFRDLGLNIDELEEVAQPYTVRTPGAIGTGRRGTILEAGQFRGNFEEFLKSQPEKYSIELLGANRYRLLQEGKIRFSDLVDKDGNLVLLKKDDNGKYIGLQK